MRTPRLSITLVGLLALAASASLAQRNFDNVEIEIVPVSGNVSMLLGSGGNIGVSAGDDGLLIIDDQFAPLSGKIKAALGEISTGDLDFVLNTHYHGDHTGGNEVFGLEALIVAHDNVLVRLSSPQTIRGNTTPAAPVHARPVITFDDSMAIHFNGEKISLYHVPAGHTDGDSVVYFHDSNVVHMGDHFFAGRFPFVDLGAGGTAQGLADNVGRVLENVSDDIKVIPGHGPLSTKQDLQLYHDMLLDTLSTVQAGIDGGKSLDEIKADGLSDSWDGWGSGFINEGVWIETIHQSLTQ